MPWDGRISGWDIFVSSLEKNDPNFRCAKSAGVNASMGSLAGAVVGFILTNTFVKGCAMGGFSGFFTVFIGSNCMCVYKNLKELEQETKT